MATEENQAPRNSNPYGNVTAAQKGLLLDEKNFLMQKIKNLPDREAAETTSETNVWSQSAFQRIPRVDVEEQTAKLIEGVINSNKFVLIGNRDERMHEFIKTAKSAFTFILKKTLCLNYF